MSSELTKVAVYGSLLSGFGNHCLLKGSDMKGAAVIEGFEMYSLGGFPCIVPDDDKGRIEVEVYDVDDTTMSRLDMLEGYPSFYDRKQVTVNTGKGDEKAWVYYMHEVPSFSGHRHAPRIESGSWRDYRFARSG